MPRDLGPSPGAALVAADPSTAIERHRAPDRPPVAAIDALDDMTRALERVLVRELRRYGVSLEES